MKNMLKQRIFLFGGSDLFISDDESMICVKFLFPLKTNIEQYVYALCI